MVKIQIDGRHLIVVLILLMISISVHSLSLNVEIAESADHRTVNLQQNENFSNLHRVNFTVENTGSIGCVYRARTVYQYDNSTVEEVWSQGHSLWPGETDRITTYKVVENRSGPVNITVNLNYCGTTEKINSFETKVDAKTVEDSSYNNLVAEIDEESSQVYLDKKADLLVPVNSPNLWKLSHANVESRTAKISYDPPIFKKRALKYYVIKDDGVQGTTELDLEAPITLNERLQVLIRQLQLNV